MKLSLNDLKLMLDCVNFNLEILEDNADNEDESIEHDLIKNLKYVRNELKKEITLATTTKVLLNYN